MAKKKHCAPEILRRIYGDRAQPLLRTIISLLTPSQALAGGCKWCSDNRCLNCSVASGEAEALSFLLRPEDPSDYRNLLTDCFIVVEEDAPRIDGCCPLNPYEWSQHVMVQRTIEMIQYETPKSNNVLCTGYDKILRSSTILECLTSAAWCLLLKRVGFSVLYHLLRSASIFLPLPCQKYLQVAGPPITNLRHTLRRKQSPLDEELGAKKKRKVGHTKLFLDGGHVNSFGIGHTSMLSTDSQRSIATSVESASCPFFKDNSHALPDGLVQTFPKNRKRERPFKWQRQKRKKQLKALENGIDVTSGELHSDGSLNSTPIEMPVLCSCCLLLQAMKKLDHGTLIERNKMFYNLETFPSVFPESHGLTILKPDICGSTSLVHEFFELPEVDRNTQTITCFHNSHCCRICSSCPYHSMIKLLKKLIRRCCYREQLKLLDKHCPLPLSMQDASQVVSEVDKTDNSFKSCSAHQVVSFVWAVVRSIVPLNLLGDERTLRKNIYRFIGLRRFEKFSVKQCLHKVKSSKFEFFTIIDPQSSGSAKTRSAVGTMMSDLKQSILNKWIYWVFSSLVVPLVQSNFYVSESEHGKQEMYYYRKPAWKEMTDGAINSMQSNMMCRNMNEANVRQIVGKRCFGFSKLRFVQKGKNGLRMLANLKASSVIPASSYSMQRQKRRWKKKKNQRKTFNGFGRLKSVNSGLRKTLAVLKGIKLKEPERLVGSYVSDYNEVYRKLCPFILNLKKKKKADDSYVYLVACDVRKAYDSINQDKLLNIIMRDVVTEAEYSLIESSELISTKNYSWIRDHFRPAALNLTTGLKFCTSSAWSVVIDKGKPNIVKREEILSVIKEVVQKSILKLENKFYLQTVGIPQGSIISPSLCSFYFGHLERNVIIPFLDRGLHRSNAPKDDATPPVERLLLRFMDDFLFLTNSKEQAILFFTRLKRGFRDYNCYMNDEKFFLNFGVGENVSLNNISQKRRAHVSQDGSTLFLKWSGLLINSATLEVQSDYSKYLSSHVRSTLTVSWQNKPELELKKKLFGFLRPKFHPILIDSNINSAAVVRLNIYQVFLLSAMKFHCYVCDLSYFCKSSSSLHFDMIKQSFRYLWGLIKRWMTRCKYNDVGPVVMLDKWEVDWLGLVAFVRVLKRKQSRHQQLIASLISELSKHKTSRSVSPDLNYAIDKSHSYQLWELRY